MKNFCKAFGIFSLLLIAMAFQANAERAGPAQEQAQTCMPFYQPVYSTVEDFQSDDASVITVIVDYDEGKMQVMFAEISTAPEIKTPFMGYVTSLHRRLSEKMNIGYISRTHDPPNELRWCNSIQHQT